MRPVSPRSRPTSEELAGQDAVFTVEVKEVRLSGLGRVGPSPPRTGIPRPGRRNRHDPRVGARHRLRQWSIDEEKKVHEDAERLTQPDWLKGVDSDQSGRAESVRAAISNALVGLKKEFYGKGPTKAKTFLNDTYVFCVMEGGLTRNEETLIERGHEALVRDYRLRFQEAMEDSTVEAIQRITGRRVIGYHSQIVFNPERAFEIFVLDRPVEDSD
jgi:uncharacterized protein YbcI